jgi:hypothetical protein
MLNHKLAIRTHHSIRLRQTRALRLVPVSPARPQILLACDSIASVTAWESALREAEVVSVASTEELAQLPVNQRFDLAVVDVAPNKLLDTLKAIRTSAEQNGLLILVEANAVTNDLSFAGVLPQYRAMVCGHSELIQLARRRLTGVTPPSRKETML